MLDEIESKVVLDDKQNEITYLRVTMLPDKLLNRIREQGTALKRSKVCTMKTCCNKYEEFIEKNYLLDLIKDLL